MKYVNAQTGVEIALGKLAKAQRDFYERALELYRRNESWLRFEEFALGPRSPLYKGHDSHLDVVKDPLYLAVEDMWLQLGVQQGMVRGKAKQNEQRGPKSGRGTPTETADREEADHVATTR
jgi:hypothetical protein